MTGHEPQALLMVRTNVDPAGEAEFNKWYTEVHLPEIIEVPGIQWGKRYRLRHDDEAYPSDDSVPTYLAIYGLDDASVLQTEKFLANRGWSDEVKPHVRDTAVAVYDLLASLDEDGA